MAQTRPSTRAASAASKGAPSSTSASSDKPVSSSVKPSSAPVANPTTSSSASTPRPPEQKEQIAKAQISDGAAGPGQEMDTDELSNEGEEMSRVEAEGGRDGAFEHTSDDDDEHAAPHERSSSVFSEDSFAQEQVPDDTPSRKKKAAPGREARDSSRSSRYPRQPVTFGALPGEGQLNLAFNWIRDTDGTSMIFRGTASTWRCNFCYESVTPPGPKKPVHEWPGVRTHIATCSKMGLSRETIKKSWDAAVAAMAAAPPPTPTSIKVRPKNFKPLHKLPAKGRGQSYTAAAGAVLNAIGGPIPVSQFGSRMHPSSEAAVLDSIGGAIPLAPAPISLRLPSPQLAYDRRLPVELAAPTPSSHPDHGPAQLPGRPYPSSSTELIRLAPMRTRSASPPPARRLPSFSSAAPTAFYHPAPYRPTVLVTTPARIAPAASVAPFTSTPVAPPTAIHSAESSAGPSSSRYHSTRRLDDGPGLPGLRSSPRASSPPGPTPGWQDTPSAKSSRPWQPASSEGSKRTACTHCMTTKTKCQVIEGPPCSRCLSKGLDCDLAVNESVLPAPPLPTNDAPTKRPATAAAAISREPEPEPPRAPPGWAYVARTPSRHGQRAQSESESDSDEEQAAGTRKRRKRRAKTQAQQTWIDTDATDRAGQRPAKQRKVVAPLPRSSLVPPPKPGVFIPFELHVRGDAEFEASVAYFEDGNGTHGGKMVRPKKVERWAGGKPGMPQAATRGASFFFNVPIKRGEEPEGMLSVCCSSEAFSCPPHVSLLLEPGMKRISLGFERGAVSWIFE